MRLTGIFLLAVTFSCLSEASYNTKASRKDGVLNVHLIAHTHDDTGWLKTVDQYYTGSNSSIQRAYVRAILDTVVKELQKNPDRKFIYVEQAFFQRWWRQQTDDIKSIVKDLVSNKQLEFVNGGYCMHDEAATHYVDMIDQTTCGHRFIKDEFNVVPTATWQIDPFGHSATHGALLSAEAGFSSLFFGRIDEQDRALRLAEARMELVWRPSASLGTDAQVWTSIARNPYGPPEGLCFDIFCDGDDPIQDDPTLDDYNVKRHVDNFVANALSDAESFLGNDIAWKMGSDFQFEGAKNWFDNLDKLIHYVNLDGRVNTLYSTPSIYAKAKFDSNLTWEVKTDDFFPYSDDPHSYWTGYFTSRAALKRYVRMGSSLLQSSRQLDLLNGGNGSALQRFTEEQALVQHHDGVSGTEKQHVAYNYALRLSQGVDDGIQTINKGLNKLLQGNSTLDFYQCLRVNESLCNVTEMNRAVAIVIYNPIARARKAYISVPINTSTPLLYDPSGARVTFQLERYRATSIPLQTGDKPSLYTLIFEANLNPLGHSTYFIQPSSTATKMHETHEAPQPQVPLADYVMENDNLRVVLNGTSGLLQSITNKVSGVTTNITQNFYWYESETRGQSSGAYIFRPAAESANIVASGNINWISSGGSVYQEVFQHFGDWLNQTIRLYSDANYLEMEWTVGPIPIDDQKGKEMISRFSSDIQSNGTWYTDSNGREMQQRKYNYRETWDYKVTEPVAGNYYPVNAAIYIKDSTRQLTLLTDRSEGGASLADGQFELMIHRRILHDDGRGVGEPMNETEGITPYPSAQRIGNGLVVRGKHLLFLNPPQQAASVWRPAQQETFSIPVVAFNPMVASDTAISDWVKLYKPSSVGSVALPVNVDVLTLQATGAGSGLLRLAHQFAVDEDAALSKSVSVDLSTLFANIAISNATELTLSGNQVKTTFLSQRPQLRTLPTKNEALYLSSQTLREKARQPTSSALTVTLAPMEIKTYQISYTLK